MNKNGFRQDSYLALLGRRLRRNLGGIAGDVRAGHTEAVLSFRTEDGGFRGRRGDADLYYTSFAVRCLDALGETGGPLSAEVAHYLRNVEPANIIEQLSLLNSLLLLGGDGTGAGSTFDFLEEFRTTDGGYAKSKGGKSGSTYHTFLAVLCYDALGNDPPGRDRLARFVSARRRADGGFCELPGARSSNTNATAAGVSLAALLGLCDSALVESAADYLLGMRHETGGWLASRHAPFPDLLSTYTALATLDLVGALDDETLADALVFARSCEGNQGGFMGGYWDDQIDVEYTYYGLGVVSLALERGLSGGASRTR